MKDTIARAITVWIMKNGSGSDSDQYAEGGGEMVLKCTLWIHHLSYTTQSHVVLLGYCACWTITRPIDK